MSEKHVKMRDDILKNRIKRGRENRINEGRKDMSSLLVYPFCREFSEFARCLGLLKEYTEVIPVTPRGLGMEGEDVGVCDGGKNLGIKISSDFDTGIKKADAVFFGYRATNRNSYREKIKTAVNLEKRVYVTRELMDFLGEEEEFRTVEVLDYAETSVEEEEQKGLLPIPVPVIMVLGIGDLCDKFNIQLKLGDYFSRQGYRVMNCTTKSFGTLFGMEPLPRFLFGPLENHVKIRRFNSYLYDRVIKENPELVIIGVPGGIMQVNPYRFREFGELAFVISNAVKADISILSLYKQEYTSDFMDHMRNICRYKLNFPVNYINVANTDFFISPEDRECQYTTVRSSHILDRIIKEFVYEEAFLFHSLDDDSMTEACDRMLCELEENR